jgi:hypothetical protein
VVCVARAGAERLLDRRVDDERSARPR